MATRLVRSYTLHLDNFKNNRLNLASFSASLQKIQVYQNYMMNLTCFWDIFLSLKKCLCSNFGHWLLNMKHLYLRIMFRLEKFYLLPKCATYCKLEYIMNFKSIRVHYFVFSINIWHINDTVKRFIVQVVVRMQIHHW